MRQLTPEISKREKLASGVTQLVLGDVTLSLDREKVLAHVSFRKQPSSGRQTRYGMSEWTSCTYDKSKLFSFILTVIVTIW